MLFCTSDFDLKLISENKPDFLTFLDVRGLGKLQLREQKVMDFKHVFEGIRNPLHLLTAAHSITDFSQVTSGKPEHFPPPAKTFL